ncbi:MAG TPA: hypothetical protein VM695_06815 [Phycisphaerae bacterium]|nr:hypothetical protein [Phycisphaerae bacterium]
MRNRTSALVGLLVGLSLVGALLYYGVRVMGWLMAKAERFPTALVKPGPRSAVGEYSKPAGGLSARWAVRPARVAPGERLDVRVQFRNVGQGPVALQEFTFAPVDADVLDANGRPVPPAYEAPAGQRLKIGWGTISPGSTLATSAARPDDAPAVAANVEIGLRRWVLPPGRYELRGGVSSKHFTQPGRFLERRGIALWSGEIQLPAVCVEVASSRSPASSPSGPGR